MSAAVPPPPLLSSLFPFRVVGLRAGCRDIPLCALCTLMCGARSYTKAGLTSAEAATIKKYESRFIFLEPKPEYVVDMLNNGLYR